MLFSLGLKQLLIESGIDLEKDEVNIAPVPGAFQGDNVNFGVAAAKALEEGKIDGFWANGMGAEVAVRRGAGPRVLDARRGAFLVAHRMISRVRREAHCTSYALRAAGRNDAQITFFRPE